MLRHWVPRLIDRLRAEPGLRDVASNQQDGGLEAHVEIDRSLAGRLGITPAAIDNTLYNAFGQRQIATIFTSTSQQRVILEVKPEVVDLALPLTFMLVDWLGGIGRALTFIGGGRGSRYKNSLIGFNGYGAGFSPDPPDPITGVPPKIDPFTGLIVRGTGEAACFGPPSVPNSPCTNLDSEIKNTGETHKLSLTYDLDDDKMVYATWSTGFRPGGANRRTPLPPYLEDTLVNYEVGFKTSWAENTFVLNGAAFYQTWDNFQFPILGLNGLTEIKNAASARIYGFEADMTWAPTDRFTVNGALSVIDAELSENFCGFNIGDVPFTDCPAAVDDPATRGDETADPEAPKGTALPVVPKFKGTLTARYEFPIGAMTGHLQGSISGQTTAPSNLLVLDQSIVGDQEGFALVDFTMGIRQDNWKAVLFITNAFDERPDLQSFVACAITTCGITGPGGNTGVNQNTAQPRTIGLRFGQTF